MSRLLACEPEGQRASGWRRMTGLQWALVVLLGILAFDCTAFLLLAVRAAWFDWRSERAVVAEAEGLLDEDAA